MITATPGGVAGGVAEKSAASVPRGEAEDAEPLIAAMATAIRAAAATATANLIP
jgi:hypothetical protein